MEQRGIAATIDAMSSPESVRFRRLPTLAEYRSRSQGEGTESIPLKPEASVLFHLYRQTERRLAEGKTLSVSVITRLDRARQKCIYLMVDEEDLSAMAALAKVNHCDDDE
ncbi:MAG: hypothetical protein Greene101449_403 [Candidatus Peregrinibacteria bacterium Greene1014_49]|nr:MAG: hypothetical protein Greene101449_403 [Candidatus Peregrinibacteria bacterium Greene1014_49]